VALIFDSARIGELRREDDVFVVILSAEAVCSYAQTLEAIEALSQAA